MITYLTSEEEAKHMSRVLEFKQQKSLSGQYSAFKGRVATWGLENGKNSRAEFKQ